MEAISGLTTSRPISPSIRGIWVEVIYTLMEAYDKLGRGSLKVEGEAVLLDFSTKDLRGTKRVPRTRPDEVAGRFERVARLLLEKGAVCVCVR
jgi:hypothetical protein